MARAKKIAFEDALKELEKIVEELENGDIALSDLLEKYAQGAKLSDLCLQELSAAEKTMDGLIQKKGNPLKRYRCRWKGKNDV